MIVGTAGHIDHGKTTLVRALTGVDTDRLPEEKARGITLQLGYAYLPVDGLDEPIGFVDVPGHERLVHTMLAGATGIDFALLLVAADDGPMPQTREHLAVLSLLGIGQGAVVITKADRVNEARRRAVEAEARALVQHSVLADAPLLAVSATDGRGLPGLRELLVEAARKHRRAEDDGRAFRLAVDRAFTLDGVGTVVTGTAHAGRVRTGQALQLGDPADGRQVRVRSLHAQNRAVAQAGAGQRCAVGLAGLERAEVQRGQWLVEPSVALATSRLDVRLQVWPGEAKALKTGQPVQVHLGATAVAGSVAVLDGGREPERLQPGEQGLVQLVLQAPLGAWHGDRLVLRDASASRTLAGGTVIDPFAPARYRRSPQRLQELQALQAPTAAGRLRQAVACAPQGLDLLRFARAQGLTAVEPLRTALPEGCLSSDEAGATWVLGAAQADQAAGQVLQALTEFHERAPDELGPDATRLRRIALPRLSEPLWRALLQRLRDDGRIARRGAFVHLPAHGVRLSDTETRIAQKAAPRLAAAGVEGAWVRDLARDGGEPEALMRTTLARLAQRGELHQVVRDLYYPEATMAALAGTARRLAAEHGGTVTAAAFRDATGLGRKRAIQVLEHFDRIGLLRRTGDLHRLRADCLLFLPEA
ncbi:selenocysteine-specific translation elongation factor [Aquabacterium sp. J223]|uniref:selenocysteine-specific translation elongation factor n=1 Tax=Aquabacterium sp. J223 TaxID=2898431 RepID=UPI0021AD5784|nr:selenocysteine-specific translation elongation factor [Aquabacterium sp. J223]UUX94347.1 selenocysteine-specific translation elongation factor [Aquabacterium sp. J223]